MISNLIKNIRTKPAKQTSLLYGSQIFSMILGFVATIIVTRILGPEKYGILAFILVVITFASSFFEFGFFPSGSRILATSKSKNKDREIIGSLTIFTLIVSIIFFILIFIFSFYVDRIFHTASGSILRSVSILTIIMPFQFMLQLIFQGNNQITKMAVQNIMPKFLYLTIIILLLNLFKLNVFIILIINLGTLALITILLIVSLKPKFTNFKKNLKLLYKETKEYGYHVYIGRIVATSTYNLDSIFISYFINTTVVGFYNLGVIITNPIAILSQSLATTLFKNFANEKSISRKVITFNMAWLTICTIGLILLGKTIIIILFTSKYLSTVPLIFPLAISAFFLGLYQPYNMFLFAHRKGNWLRKTAFVMGGANLIGNIILIPTYGAMGAAVASIIGNLIYFILIYFYYHKYQSQLKLSDDSYGTKDYFEKIFSETSTDDDPWGHNWRISQKIRYQRLLNFLKTIHKRKNLKILDIGCSLGDFTFQLKKIFTKSDICGVDISEEAIKKAKIKYAKSKIKFQTGALPNLSKFKNNSLDLVLILEVIYYLDDRKRKLALKEIQRILRKNGYLLISVNINKPPYFQIHEFRKLMSKYFEIEKVGYDYGKIYNYFEQKLYLLDDTFLKKFSRYMLSLKFPFFVSEKLTKIFMKNHGIDNMYILARNHKD